MPEVGDYLFIYRPLERHDQRRNFIHPGPAPAVEFLRMAGRFEIDLALIAGKAHSELLLRLATILAFPGLADEMLGEVVIIPARRFRDHMGGGDGGFLREFPQYGFARALALVEAALGHLPPLALALL